jgi:hypothetical protein
MGMQVRVYKGQFGTSEWEILDEPEWGKCLAGPEASRWELWGSAVVQSIGLELLPILVNDNLHLSGEELDKLEKELELVEGNAKEISQNAPIDEYSLLVITNNIIRAIERARNINGGVIIW